MRKIFSMLLSLCLLLSFVLIFTSCKSNSDVKTDTQNPEVYTDDERRESDVQSEIEDRFQPASAITDKNGDTYYITLDKLNKISNETGEIAMMDGVYENQYGHALALHNAHIYYSFGDSLYRINKNGTEKYQYDDDNIYGDCVAIVGDNLYVNLYNDEINSMQYFTADISDDPDHLSLTPVDYNSEYFFTDEMKIKLHDYSKIIMPEYDTDVDSMDGNVQVQYPITYFGISENYLYYINRTVLDAEKGIARINTETMETETVPVFSKGLVPPAVTGGWIYYTDKNGDTYRISEDFNSTEKVS